MSMPFTVLGAVLQQTGCWRCDCVRQRFHYILPEIALGSFLRRSDKSLHLPAPTQWEPVRVVWRNAFPNSWRHYVSDKNTLVEITKEIYPDCIRYRCEVRLTCSSRGSIECLTIF